MPSGISVQRERNICIGISETERGKRLDGNRRNCENGKGKNERIGKSGKKLWNSGGWDRG